MKNQTFLVLVFLLIGLLFLTACNARYISNAAEPSAIPNLFASGVPAPSASSTSGSDNETSYSYDFNVFGKTYTAFVVTNSDVSNITMSKSGLGIQFQASVPTGTTGFFNVTVPAILLGADIAVLQDGVRLVENVSYTQIHNEADYLFYIEYSGGIHTIVVEAATSNMSTPTPSPNQSGLPMDTLVAVAVVGVVAVVSAVVIYAFKGAIFHKAGGLAGKGAVKAAKFSHGGGGGGGPAHVPVGANIIVHPHPEVGLTFSQVKIAGEVTATPLLRFPELPQGLKFVGTVFAIRTTAVFTGLVIVALAFNGKDMNDEQKKKLRVYRNDFKKDSVWEDVTSSIDTKNNIAYGASDHFSGFGVH